MPVPTIQKPIRAGITAGEDLAPKRFIKHDGTVAGAGEVAYGISDYTIKSGEEGSIIIAPEGIVTAGGAISAGAYVKSDSAGKAVTAAATNLAMGIALIEATTSMDCKIDMFYKGTTVPS